MHGGVATSGRDVRRFGPGGRLHHLIDPATGATAREGPLTVTVVAPDAVEAEAHATALAIVPPVEAAGVPGDEAGTLGRCCVPPTGAGRTLGQPPLRRREPRPAREHPSCDFGGLR